MNRSPRRGRVARGATKVALALCAALVVGATTPPAPAGAAQTQPTDPEALSVVGQTPLVEPGEDLDLRLRLRPSGAADRLEVAVTVFQRVPARRELLASIEDGRVGGSVGDVFRFPVGSLAPDPTGTVALTVPLARLELFRSGVYPVRIELRERGGDVLSRATTHLTFATEPLEDRRLGVALVVPIAAPPALAPDGSARIDRDEADRLRRLAAALAAAPTPATLLPVPESLDALVSTDPSAAAALTEAVGEGAAREVLAAPYVPVSLPSLEASGLGDEAARQLEAGTEIIEAVLDADVAGSTYASHEPVDADAASLLHDARLDRLVLPGTSLAAPPRGEPVPALEPYALELGRDRDARVLVADDALTALASRKDPVLAAQHILADLSLTALTRPSEGRGMAVLLPRVAGGDPALVSVLLEALADHPLLRATTASSLFEELDVARTSRGAQIERRPAAAARSSLPAAEVRSVRRHIAAFASMAPEHPAIEAVEPLVLAATSVRVEGARARERLLDGARRIIDAEVAKVAAPANRTITLTARTGEVPVTIRSDAGYPVRVRVVLEGRAGLDFPDGRVHEVDLTRRNTTERFAVQARSSGAFPLRVRVESPDGRILIGETRFTVRSTAASGVGVVLSLGAAGFLGLWWGRHLRQGRRARKLVPR